VEDFDYSESRDVCIVKYRSDKPAESEEKCEKIIKGINAFNSQLVEKCVLANRKRQLLLINTGVFLH